MRTVRVSEIGAFLYCKRSWWYQKQGIESANLAEMAVGTELHRRHGRGVFATGCLRLLAYGLLLSALTLITVHAVNSLLP
jgi:CRISPR/Cas system-associated exonuclease Cas4 (RecB family)